MMNKLWISLLIFLSLSAFANKNKDPNVCKNSTQTILENNDFPFIETDMIKIELNQKEIEEAANKGWKQHNDEGTSLLSRLNRSRRHFQQKLLMKFSRNGELFQYSNPNDETSLIAMVYAGRFDKTNRLKMQDRLDDLTKVDSVKIDDVEKIVRNWKDEWLSFIPAKTAFFKRLEANKQLIKQLNEVKAQTRLANQLINRFRKKNTKFQTKYFGLSGELIKPLTIEIERIDGQKITKVIRSLYEIEKEIDDIVHDSLKIDNTFITKMFFTNKKGSLTELNIRQGFLSRKLSMVNDALVEMALTFKEKGQEIPIDLISEINEFADMLGDHLFNKSLEAYVKLTDHIQEISDQKLLKALNSVSKKFEQKFGDNAHEIADEIEGIYNNPKYTLTQETRVVLHDVFHTLDKVRRIRPSYKSMDEVLKQENKTEWKYLKMDIKKREEYLLALRFYNALTTKDKNRLGLNNIEAGIKFIKRSRYGMFLVGGFTMLDGLFYFYQWMHFYEVERAQCVNKKSELAFFKCSQKIINNAIVENDELGAILKEFGVKSPEYEKRFNEMVEQEIQQLAVERVAFLNQKHAQEDFKEDVKKRLKKAVYENPELSRKPVEDDPWFPFPPMCGDDEDCGPGIDPILGPEDPIGIMPITPIFLPNVPTPIIPLSTHEMEFLSRKQKAKVALDIQRTDSFENIQITKVDESESEKSVSMRKLSWLYQSYLMAYGELYLHADNLHEEIKNSAFETTERMNLLRAYNIKLAEHYENLIDLKEDVKKLSLDQEIKPENNKTNIYFSDYKKLTREIQNLNQDYQNKHWYIQSPWYGPVNMLPRLGKGLIEMVY